MTLYALVLFIHVSAALVLFAALSVEVLSWYRLRRASTIGDARAWVEPVPKLPLIVASSGVIILLSGVFLAMRMSVFGVAWPEVTVAALLLMAPLGSVSGRRMRAIRRACTDATVINDELLSRLAESVLEDLTMHANLHLLCHCFAHGRESRFVEVDQHRWSLPASWGRSESSRVASRNAVRTAPGTWAIDDVKEFAGH